MSETGIVSADQILDEYPLKGEGFKSPDADNPIVVESEKSAENSTEASNKFLGIIDKRVAAGFYTLFWAGALVAHIIFIHAAMSQEKYDVAAKYLAWSTVPVKGIYSGITELNYLIKEGKK